ncbi:FKBP-type peptidyl-prolyl cis-trans isomerase [Pontibacter liquoris]|uniref:FKBP-type peptidyl-prolyl cis-trans isomerase n=1 Tax=Pontibacter liquoris TaxID=2905677 RepID=UPI001FA70EB7|nr:FKBP-type peptidyl-prolyl cis-trans isomerase [Pontibacter liquoris]
MSFPFINLQNVKASSLLKALLFLVLSVSFASCGDTVDPYTFDVEGQKKLDEQTIRQYFRLNKVDTTAVVRTSSGLYYLNDVPGTGVQIKAGDEVEVHYIGKFVNNATFDSSYDRGDSFSFVVGAGQVIKGWDEGLQLMKVGEEAHLFIPSHLGYGPRGRGSVPPSAVLIFEIKAISVK